MIHWTAVIMVPYHYYPFSAKFLKKQSMHEYTSFLSLINLYIVNRQFGFRANHSTNHALISMMESIKSYLDNGEFVAGIFIDLEKAFDTVNHEI